MHRFSYHVRYTKYSVKELHVYIKKSKILYDTNRDCYFAGNFENNLLRWRLDKNINPFSPTFYNSFFNFCYQAIETLF